MLNKSNLFDILRKSYSYLSEYNPFNYILPPVRYFLELTYRCNLNCEFCFINGSRKKNELSTNEWFNIINQIPFYSFISLVAGEVLLREDFLKILNKSCLKTLGKVSIITNGVLLNKDLVKEFIKNCNCFVLPSWHEGMANTNLESAACGRPIITSNIHGCKEAVENEITGYLCEKNNADDLYRVLKKFIELPYIEKKKMGMASRKRMEMLFDREKIISQTIDKLSKGH